MRNLPFVVALLFSSPAFAAPDGVTTPTMPDAPNVESMLVRLFAWTAFLLLLCAGLFWFSRRIQKPSRPGTKSGGMEFIASAPLNRKCALHIIEANGQKIVIATDLTGIKEMVPLTDSFATVLQQAGEI